MHIFNEERRNYYKAKKRELLRVNANRQVIKQDALYIYHYGMSAYLELFPEAKEFGMNWHTRVIRELQIMERKRLGDLLSGHYAAIAATKSKKSQRNFVRIIKDLFKKE